MRRFILLTPFLFVLASLLQLNYVAAIIVSPDQIVRPLVVLWGLVFFLLWPAHWITRDWNWATVLLTIFVAGFCFSSAFFSTVLLLITMLSVIWLAFLRLTRSKASIVQFACLLSGTAFFFIGYSIFLTGRAFSRIPWEDYQRTVSEARAYSLGNLSVPSAKPDIYFIVLDGYLRSDVLQEIYEFDNSDFVTYLKSRDFVVPASSVSNYPATHLSIASMLNMDYIQSFSPGLEENYNRWLMSPFIDRSRVRAILEQQGYTTVSISTNWSITDNTTTEAYFKPYQVMLSDFEGYILDTTPLKLSEPLLENFVSIPSAESQRNVISYNFDTLAALPELPGPKFVFAHVIAPHPPFVYDRFGNPVDMPYSFSFKDASDYPGTREEYRRKYLDQLQFVNDNLQRVVESILAESKVPPIILLQADHGSGMFVDFQSSQNNCIKERFSPFAAYYLPGLVDDSIPADISAVNIFRILFNEYFHANLPVLENRQYFYKKSISFYEFEDVTSRVADPCTSP